MSFIESISPGGEGIRIIANRPGRGDEAEYAGKGYGEFKGAVAEAVVDFLAPVRERYEELRPDESALESTLSAGAEKARAIASDTLADVRAAMGVGPPK